MNVCVLEMHAELAVRCCVMCCLSGYVLVDTGMGTRKLCRYFLGQHVSQKPLLPIHRQTSARQGFDDVCAGADGVSP